MKFAIGAMSIGDVLDRSLKILLARFPQFFVVNFVCQAPFIVLAALAPVFINRAVEDAADPTSVFIYTIIAALIGALLYFLMVQISTAATLRIVLDEYSGRPSSIGEAFSFAFSRFLPLVGTTFLASLLILVGFLLIIPGIYLSIAFAFVSQVVVLENLSGPDALKRSRFLVKGYWWRVLGTAFLISFVTQLIQSGLQTVLHFVWPAMETYQEQVGTMVTTAVRPNYSISAIQQIVTCPVPIVLATYLGIAMTLLYLDLRIRKEAFDLELAAASDNPAEAQ